MYKQMLSTKEKNKRIKILLIEKGISITQLAKLVGRSRPYVSQVLYGHIKRKPTRRAIAEALGVPYEELWDE